MGLPLSARCAAKGGRLNITHAMPTELRCKVRAITHNTIDRCASASVIGTTGKKQRGKYSMAKWKTKTLNSVYDERMIITGMITSDEFLEQVMHLVDIDLLQVQYSRQLARWCMEYYASYRTAPGKMIQTLFDSYAADKSADAEQVELIEKFLSSLSEDYSEEAGMYSNVQYMLDKAEEYFRSRSLHLLSANIEADVLAGDVEAAEHRVSTYDQIGLPTTHGIDILRDHQAIIQTLSHEEDALLQLPGAVGKLLGPFAREDFVAVAAPAKRGKSWWLQDIGMKALMRKLRVVFFCFEMPEWQMMRRFYQYLLAETKRPMNDLPIPFFADRTGMDIDYKYINKRGVTPADAVNKAKKLQQFIKRGGFKLITAPARTTSVNDIRMHLDNLERYKKFVPDVIITDYADIMRSDLRTDESRHKIDDIWSGLRGLAQERHALVVTGTHSNRATFNRDVDVEDIVEDIRKINHVACMFAINQKADDKKNLASRIKVLAGRHESFGDDEVMVLQQLEIGRPCIASRFIRN